MVLVVRGNIAQGWQLNADGTAQNPAIQFPSASQSGIFHAGNGVIGIAVNGNAAALISGNGVSVSGNISASNANVTSRVTTHSITAHTITSNSLTSNSLTISGNNGTAVISAPSADVLSIATAGIERLRISGNVVSMNALSVPTIDSLTTITLSNTVAMSLGTVPATTSGAVPTCPVAPSLALDVMTLSLAHNANVTTWGNATGYAVGTGSYPIFKKLSDNEPGDRWVQLNGVSNVAGSYLDFGPTIWNVATNGGFTFVGYVKFTGTPGSNERLFDFGSGTSNVITYYRATTTTNGQTGVTNAAGTVFTGTAQKLVAQERWQVVAMRVQNEGVNTWRLSQWEDGIKYAGAATLAATLVDRTVTNSYVGRSYSSADAYASLAIREMLFYNDDLLDSEIAQITAYLKSKYDARYYSPGGTLSNIVSINNFRLTNIQHWASPGNPMKYDILNYLKASRDGCAISPALDGVRVGGGTYPGTGAFAGGVLLPDGRIFCVPYSSTTARIYDPAADILSTPTGAYPGTAAFVGGVLLPDGRVFCIPNSSTTSRIYDPVTDTLSTPTGTYAGTGAFIGGVLLNDGRVFCIPNNSTTARIYDPVTDTLSTPTGTYAGTIAFSGGVLLPDGRVFCVPRSSTTARIYDPVTDILSTPTGTYPGSNAFLSGVLLPDGRVFCVPYSSTTARIYDPVTDTLSTPTGTYPGSTAFLGGVLLPDGRVFCVPYTSTTARIYDPVTDTLSVPAGTYPGSSAFYGGVLLPDGRVFCVPFNSTTSRLAHCGTWGSVRLPMTVLTSPFLNKF